MFNIISNRETPNKSPDIIAHPPEGLKSKRMATPVVSKDMHGRAGVSYPGKEWCNHFGERSSRSYTAPQPPPQVWAGLPLIGTYRREARASEGLYRRQQLSPHTSQMLESALGEHHEENNSGIIRLGRKASSTVTRNSVTLKVFRGVNGPSPTRVCGMQGLYGSREVAELNFRDQKSELWLSQWGHRAWERSWELSLSW